MVSSSPLLTFLLATVSNPCVTQTDMSESPSDHGAFNDSRLEAISSRKSSLVHTRLFRGTGQLHSSALKIDLLCRCAEGLMPRQALMIWRPLEHHTRPTSRRCLITVLRSSNVKADRRSSSLFRSGAVGLFPQTFKLKAKRPEPKLCGNGERLLLREDHKATSLFMSFKGFNSYQTGRRTSRTSLTT